MKSCVDQQSYWIKKEVDDMLFEVSAQYAHHSIKESEALGTMSSRDVLKCFDEFKWELEIAEAERLEKVSPGLSVEDTANYRLIWVSGCGEPTSPTFVSECSFPGMKKRLFGFLGERMGVVELHTGGFDTRQARLALELFMSNDETALRQLYQTVEFD